MQCRTHYVQEYLAAMVSGSSGRNTEKSVWMSCGILVQKQKLRNLFSKACSNTLVAKGYMWPGMIKRARAHMHIKSGHFFEVCGFITLCLNICNVSLRLLKPLQDTMGNAIKFTVPI